MLSILPVQVALTGLVPHNVEASTMALITGSFVWSYEVGAKISASLYCLIFGVDDDHMDNYAKALFAKMAMIPIMMLLTLMIPSNAEISSLRQQLREERQQKQNSKLNYLGLT